MPNKHLLVGGAKCNRAGGLPGTVGPGSYPVAAQNSRSWVFLVHISTAAGESTLFIIVQHLDSYTVRCSDITSVFEHEVHVEGC